MNRTILSELSYIICTLALFFLFSLSIFRILRNPPKHNTRHNIFHLTEWMTDFVVCPHSLSANPRTLYVYLLSGTWVKSTQLCDFIQLTHSFTPFTLYCSTWEATGNQTAVTACDCNWSRRCFGNWSRQRLVASLVIAAAIYKSEMELLCTHNRTKNKKCSQPTTRLCGKRRS